MAQIADSACRRAGWALRVHGSIVKEGAFSGPLDHWFAGQEGYCGVHVEICRILLWFFLTYKRCFRPTAALGTFQRRAGLF